ncbi:hypothetical protein [Arthrobacter sp. KBS0703]|uniref:hypothetical protein n=1 Tax=Arthrobacter sp. KBS0703 TaxID=1955698 RepID=UPI00163DE468
MTDSQKSDETAADLNEVPAPPAEPTDAAADDTQAEAVQAEACLLYTSRCV